MKRTLITLLVLTNVFIISAQTDNASYSMAGPYEVVARDGEHRNSKAGSERDMRAALNFAEQGNIEQATAIIDAYAVTLQRLDGHDAPLCAIQCYDLVKAMTAVKLLSTSPVTGDDVFSVRKNAWEGMIRRALVPMMQKFEAESPYANGNWGAIVNRLRMACAIFLDDKDMYNEAVNYYLHAYDNGSLPHYISETGQCQETGRDQSHVQLGLGMLCDICEMAWQQGDDLWGALDNRLLKGIEYCARYNLGKDVPFETWQDCTGLYCLWTEPGEMGRGRLRDIYEKPYRHYVEKMGLSMPYTKQALAVFSKARKRGEISEGYETVTCQVPGVKEKARLHEVYAYPAPQGAPLKHDYEVFVQPRGKNEWTRIDTYMARVNAPVGNNRHKISEISYAMFDFTGDVFVRVVCKNKKFKNAHIRPDYKGVIANTQSDSTVQFMLFQPENVSIEFDGNITDNLLLFTSKPCIDMKTAEKEAHRQGRKFAYYPAGFYTEDTIRVESKTTVYLSGGSYFTGTFAIDDAHDVSIIGRGIARPPRGYEGCHVYRSKNILIDGMVVNTCPVGESSGVTLHDVRSISHPSWGDGLNVFASENVLFDRVFCRNSDDCTTAYATRKGFNGSTRNVRMANSTLWADVAHPVFVGLHGNSERGDTIENITYENIDILCQSEPQVDYQGCLAINAGDNNLVRNILFDNIRIESLHQGALFHVKVSYNQKYCTAPGRGVDGVTFRNIRYKGAEKPYLSVINGYNDERRVRNVSFEALRINGQLLYENMPGKLRWYSTADYVPMFIGNHVDNVVFAKNVGEFNVEKQLSYCSSQIDRALESLRPYDFTMMPRNILKTDRNGTWNLRKASAEEWCSGFWAGVLWMDFNYNKSEAVSKAAEGYTRALSPIVEQPVFDHDLGFIIINSFLKGYEQTHEPYFKQVALKAADSLATLFNPAAGTLLSWPRHVKDYGGHNTIIDNMLNLELLFWAADNGGDGRLRDIAVKHAETTMQNHFRKDGSCFHVAVYNEKDGHFIKGVTHQGYKDDSMWSRGQAWAIYGYTMVYRFTKEQRFLDFAMKVADIYLKRLRETSDDWVPLWDMDAPSDMHEKDASAAAVVASALLELYKYADKEHSTTYKDAATKMLEELSSPRYMSGSENVALLKHSTGHHPAGSEIDASIIYADYYYLEALLRYKGRR